MQKLLFNGLFARHLSTNCHGRLIAMYNKWAHLLCNCKTSEKNKNIIAVIYHACLRWSWTFLSAHKERLLSYLIRTNTSPNIHCGRGHRGEHSPHAVINPNAELARLVNGSNQWNLFLDYLLTISVHWCFVLGRWSFDGWCVLQYFEYMKQKL